MNSNDNNEPFWDLWEQDFDAPVDNHSRKIAIAVLSWIFLAVSVVGIVLFVFKIVF